MLFIDIDLNGMSRRFAWLLFLGLQLGSSVSQPSSTRIALHSQTSERLQRAVPTSEHEILALVSNHPSMVPRHASKSEDVGSQVAPIDLQNDFSNEAVRRSLESNQSSAAQPPQNATETFGEFNLDTSTTAVYHCPLKLMLTSLGESVQNYIR
jgi:hypothetical protein